MALIIRDVIAPEVNEVTSLTINAYQKYAHALTIQNWEAMRTSLSNVAEIAKTGQLIVACQDRVLVGSVVYCPPGTSDSRLCSTAWASLRMLAVLPQYQGCGIGQMLCSEGICRARQDKAEAIALHTSELMIQAQKLYERLGFKRDIELPRHLGIRYWRYVLELT